MKILIVAILGILVMLAIITGLFLIFSKLIICINQWIEDMYWGQW